MKNQHTFQLRIPAATLQQLELASQKTGLTRQNICRVAISLGLGQLAKAKYHLPPALKAQAETDAHIDSESSDDKKQPATTKVGEGAVLASVPGSVSQVPGLDFPADG